MHPIDVSGASYPGELFGYDSFVKCEGEVVL